MKKAASWRLFSLLEPNAFTHFAPYPLVKGLSVFFLDEIG